MNTKWPEFDVIRRMKPDDPQGGGDDGTGNDDPDGGNQKPPTNP